MSGHQLQAVIRHIRQLHGGGPVADPSDRQLLRRFVSEGDHDAFAALVRRHAPLVWGTCRRVLRHDQDAEDAFQATFLILARRAGAVSWKPSIGGWLYVVAHRLAVRMRTRAARQRLCEREASHVPITEESLRELGAVVDEELQRLPEKYRLPLLLHYLEGKTAEATARELGLTRGTFYNRLTRGRELLRGRLTRRGLTLSASLVAAALTKEAEAVPPALVNAAIGTTLGRVPASVTVLAAGGLNDFGVTKVKVALALFLVLGTVAGGIAAWPRQAPGSPVPTAERPKANETRPIGVDRQGDPLPAGAVARLGTLRWRGGDEVEALAFAPDGKTIAAMSPRGAASNRGVFLFDVTSGKLKKHIGPSDRFYRRIAFSPDGTRLACTCTLLAHGREKDKVQIWDLSRENESCDFDAENVYSLGWSADNKPWAVLLGKQAIVLRELATGKERRFMAKDLPLPARGLSACAYAAERNLLAAPDAKGALHVWDSATGKTRCTLKPRGDYVFSLAISPDGRTLASLGYDVEFKYAVQLWDLATGKAVRSLAGDQKFLAAVVFSPDGKTLATVGHQDVRFWDMVNGQERSRTKGDQSFGQAVAFSTDGRTLATVETYSGTIHRWDVATGTRKPEPVGHGNKPYQVAYSPDGRRVATGGSEDGTIYVWDPATGKSLTRIHRGGWVGACAFSADGRSLFSCWTDDKLCVSDVAGGQELFALKLEDPDRPDTEQSGAYLYLSDDRKTLVALSYYEAKKGGGFIPELLVTGWDTTTRKQLFRRRRGRNDFSMAVSVDAKMLAVSQGGGPGAMAKEAPGTGPMRLEDLATGKHILTFPKIKGQTWPLDFSPDGRLMASFTGDGESQTLRVWEVATASEVLAIRTVLNSRVAFSPDGRIMAMSAPKQEILLWDLRKGQKVRRLHGFGADVTSLAFSPDGRRLVSGLSDSTLLVWDVARQAVKPKELDAAGVALAWTDLAGDSGKAFAARGTLADSPEKAVTLLKEHLKPSRAADAQRLRKLIADLDSERFAVRETARKGLEELGDLAEPALRETLKQKPSLELRQQVKGLLEKLRGPVTRPEMLQALRAVAVLEDVGTPAARSVLERLATGADEARLTREAKTSLKRLERRIRSKK
jgi:RNA polymerase sigma factor (sigma-70 family)